MNEEEIISKLTATGRYKVIKKFEPVEQYNTANPDAEILTGIFLDTETTGMDPDKDKVIELAMVPFEFDSYGNIYRVLPEYNAFQDPGEPIPGLITQITGITDEMVKGQAIDLD
ncbi:MAG: exonuclease domain-containing protein, partial [Thioalkalispiraceae bacterium]